LILETKLTVQLVSIPWWWSRLPLLTLYGLSFDSLIPFVLYCRVDGQESEEDTGEELSEDDHDGGADTAVTLRSPSTAGQLGPSPLDDIIPLHDEDITEFGHAMLTVLPRECIPNSVLTAHLPLQDDRDAEFRVPGKLLTLIGCASSW
jgi:hypothetical protein